MTRIQKAVSEYLAVRRKLGFGLRLTGGALRSFAAFLKQHGASRISTALALAWAKGPASAQPAQWAN